MVDLVVDRFNTLDGSLRSSISGVCVPPGVPRSFQYPRWVFEKFNLTAFVARWIRFKGFNTLDGSLRSSINWAGCQSSWASACFNTLDGSLRSSIPAGALPAWALPAGFNTLDGSLRSSMARVPGTPQARVPFQYPRWVFEKFNSFA